MRTRVFSWVEPLLQCTSQSKNKVCSTPPRIYPLVHEFVKAWTLYNCLDSLWRRPACFHKPSSELSLLTLSGVRTTEYKLLSLPGTLLRAPQDLNVLVKKKMFSLSTTSPQNTDFCIGWLQDVRKRSNISFKTFFFKKVGRRNPNFDIWKCFHLFYNFISQLVSWENMTETVALENTEIIFNTAVRVTLFYAAFQL